MNNREALTHGRTYANKVPQPFLDVKNFLDISSTTAGTFLAERQSALQRKNALRHDLANTFELPQFAGAYSQKDTDALDQKLFRFRPRSIGALVVYSSLSGSSYEDIQSQGGRDLFSLFWALGSIQDDFIDELPKDTIGTKGERKKDVAVSIFGDERKFYRGIFYTLKKKLGESDFGEPEKRYLVGKVASWYQFLVDQEADVLGTEFENYTFGYCKNYRELQNQKAGEVLVALLNGRACLDPKKQALEKSVPRFSYLTQIVDDIADLPEDVIAERPSYAVGALVSNPEELARVVQKVKSLNKPIKVTPREFHELAPNSAEMVDSLFQQYREQLVLSSVGGNGEGLSVLAQAMHSWYPYLRGALFKINPSFANF